MPLSASLSLVATKKDLTEIRDFIEETGKKFGLDPELIAQVRLAVDEAVANVLEHGYRNQPGWVEVIIQQEQLDLMGYIIDKSMPFDPTQVPPPDLSIPAPLRSPGGMGLTLIKQALDELRYEAPPAGGNRLIMIWQNVFDNSTATNGS
ncbi:MAG: ATP-binding protein [Anaerolineales bacterium]|nr:ATP-binding protein [Anaerolineales bacterium]